MIKGFIGPDYNSDGSDVVKAKQALKKLGYYTVPKYGVTEYADKGLFSAIEDFQKDKGIKPTGQIKKDDKTAKTLSSALAEVEGEYDEDNEAENSPIFRCTECGGPHGGSQGDLCPSCAGKAS